MWIAKYIYIYIHIPMNSPSIHIHKHNYEHTCSWEFTINTCIYIWKKSLTIHILAISEVLSHSIFWRLFDCRPDWQLLQGVVCYNTSQFICRFLSGLLQTSSLRWELMIRNLDIYSVGCEFLICNLVMYHNANDLRESLIHERAVLMNELIIYPHLSHPN